MRLWAINHEDNPSTSAAMVCIDEPPDAHAKCPRFVEPNVNEITFMYFKLHPPIYNTTGICDIDINCTSVDISVKYNPAAASFVPPDQMIASPAVFLCKNVKLPSSVVKDADEGSSKYAPIVHLNDVMSWPKRYASTIHNTAFIAVIDTISPTEGAAEGMTIPPAGIRTPRQTRDINMFVDFFI